jgi:transposase-like protein
MTVVGKTGLKKLPRLNRKGTALRKHYLNPKRLREVVVEEEIASIKTAAAPRISAKRAPKKKTKDGRINLAAMEKIDPKAQRIRENARELNQEMEEAGRISRTMTLEEKIFILEKYFSHSWGIKKIAKQIGRASSSVTRFVDKYRSTATLAKLHIEAQAENLAKRVTAKANVEESLEILDRIDVLPKKERKSEGGNSFNIIVGMPGAQGVRGAIPVPSQKQIEAARTPEMGSEE